jgi:hypothetical protein
MDRFIAAEWMELAASIVRGEMSPDGLHERIELSAGSPRVQTMTLSILNRMWFPKEEAAKEIVNSAARLATLGAGERAAAFVTVAIMAYPYFRQVTEHVGRLLRLQGSCSSGEVHRRMFELHGKRTAIDQATSYAFKTLISWGVLSRDADNRLVSLEKLAISPTAKVLLDRAANRSRDSVTPLEAGDPLLFPFAIK